MPHFYYGDNKSLSQTATRRAKRTGTFPSGYIEKETSWIHHVSLDDNYVDFRDAFYLRR